MKQILLASILITTPSYLVAGGTNGGTPPALEQLQEILMSAVPGSGALFDNGLGDFGLLTNGKLQPQMTLARSQLPSTNIMVPEGDFSMLRDRKMPIDSVGSSGEKGSYRISDGDQIDTLILIDRRASVRAGVTQ